MRIKGKEIKIKQIFYLVLYYGFARYLPKSNTFGNIGGEIRYLICKQIFKRCGKHVNIERKAYFASGVDIEIGDYSGIGINAQIPNGTIIGDYVMMGPNCFILDVNHDVSDVSLPMALQGSTEKKTTQIGNDCMDWQRCTYDSWKNYCRRIHHSNGISSNQGLSAVFRCRWKSCKTNKK